ncbi:hypothetical protein I6N96_10855 [Enterococcus sp. BWM-S5]|uniref:Uncharacterized protein n=1 Tax=Enterococcus larvae TaxID=2794352 RepID=A0ABS4CL47_9ENTE|nr:hypothetical protein [Enterococcus larvae]MBP1046765.1 hypothetical protein [Enterococcus larvae]
MSFVSAFISKDFASIMSDGQVTGNNKRAVQEDYKKIIKVNNFLVGFTGNGTAPIELIKAAIKETGVVIGLGILNKELLLTLIEKCLDKYRQHAMARINIVLVGFNKGTPFINTFSLDNSEIFQEKFELAESKYRLITLCPFDYKLENGSEGFIFMEKVDVLDEKEMNLDKIIKFQHEMNDFVADNSDTVNKHVFSEYVKNDRSES